MTVKAATQRLRLLQKVSSTLVSFSIIGEHTLITTITTITLHVLMAHLQISLLFMLTSLQTLIFTAQQQMMESIGLLPQLLILSITLLESTNQYHS